MNKNTLAFQSWRGKTSHRERFEDIPWNLSMNNPGSMTLKRSFSLSSVFSFLSWGKGRPLTLTINVLCARHYATCWPWIFFKIYFYLKGQVPERRRDRG